MKTYRKLGLPSINDPTYLRLIYLKAEELQSDGCSGVPDFYIKACWEHDVHYRTHQTIFGRPITRAQADAVFRQRIQEMSLFGVLSPMSWWRWTGLRIAGGRAWAGQDTEPQVPVEAAKSARRDSDVQAG